MNSAELQSRPENRGAKAADFLDRLAANLLRLGVRGRIQRVDISRSGDVTVLAAVGGQQQWMWIDPVLATDSVQPDTQESLRELNVSDDRKIPLARQLAAMDSGPGLTVLSYLPGRRLVMLDSRGSEAVVLKGYRKGKGSGSAERYELAARATVPGRFFAPTPIRINELHDYMTLPLVDGRPFQVSDERMDDFEELGRGISALQAIDCSGANIDRFDRADELEVIDERARRMGLVGCATPDSWKQLRHRLSEVSLELQDSAFVPAHRDLHDGQLLQSVNGIALLDFDLLCVAEPELDAANFLAHLALRRLQMPHRISDACVQACGKKFLDGLSAYQREGFWERLRFYQATTFCRLQLVYSMRPKWNGIVDSLGRLGHRCLDDLEHLAA